MGIQFTKLTSPAWWEIGRRVLSPRAGSQPEGGQVVLVASVATSFAFDSNGRVVYKPVEPDPPRKSLPWYDCGYVDRFDNYIKSVGRALGRMRSIALTIVSGSTTGGESANCVTAWFSSIHLGKTNPPARNQCLTLSGKHFSFRAPTTKLNMKRRTLLAATGTGVASVAGCLGTGESNSETGSQEQGDQTSRNDEKQSGYEPETATDPDPTLSSAGLPRDPEPETVADIEPTNESAFELNTYKGVDVPLVPAKTARYWYHEQKARVIDARSYEVYQRSHIPGALSSPAGGTDRGADEINNWDETARIVTYCGCPHHLSSHRAMELYESGHTAVYAIDEGFGVWSERGYETTGEESSFARSWHIDGKVSARYAGEIATVKRPQSEQLLYAKPIGEEGTFSLKLRSADVEEHTVVVVKTPSGSKQATVRELATSIITA